MKLLLPSKFLFLSGILLLYSVVGLYKLEALPGEWFGDISNLHEYVLDIQHGKWPISYRQGVGPLYHYAVTPLVPLTGQRYIGYKLLSVFFGAVSLAAIFLLAHELGGNRLAIATTAVTAVSFWFLAWARLGNLHAILPGILACTVWAAKRWNTTQKLYYIVMGSMISVTGLFLYLGSVFIPVIFFLLITKKKISVLIVLLVFGFAGLFFMKVVQADTNEFFSPHGYIGEKWTGLTTTPVPLLLIRMGEYAIRTAGMLHLRGDHIFRINVPDRPMLDVMSGILFLIGLLRLRKHKKYFLLPFLVIIPAIVPSLQSNQIPSATRTFLAVPFVFLLVGMGLMKLGRLGIVAIFIIAVLNLQNYFVAYPKTLPDHNTAIGAIIAQYIDALPRSTQVHLVDCCWGEWGQPEPKGIYYQLRNPQGREHLKNIESEIFCNQIAWDQPVVFIVAPGNQVAVTHLMSCEERLLFLKNDHFWVIINSP